MTVTPVSGRVCAKAAETAARTATIAAATRVISSLRGRANTTSGGSGDKDCSCAGFTEDTRDGEARRGMLCGRFLSIPMEVLMKVTFLAIAVLAAAAAVHAEDTLKTANIQRYYTPV